MAVALMTDDNSGAVSVAGSLYLVAAYGRFSLALTCGWLVLRLVRGGF